MKKPKVSSTYRLSDLTRGQIKKMAESLQASEADIISTAVHYLHSKFSEISKDSEFSIELVNGELRQVKIID
jgi:cytoskeletal protein RodZ